MIEISLAFVLTWWDLVWIFPVAAVLLEIGYLALQHLERVRRAQGLTDPQRVLAGLLLVPFGLLDVLLNWTFCIVLFLELPRELTISRRCMRHFKAEGWRGDIARWLGRHALDPFDPRGAHINADVIAAYYAARKEALHV